MLSMNNDWVFSALVRNTQRDLFEAGCYQHDALGASCGRQTRLSMTRGISYNVRCLFIVEAGGRRKMESSSY